MFKALETWVSLKLFLIYDIKEGLPTREALLT
jgi:hypothetical protein